MNESYPADQPGRIRAWWEQLSDKDKARALNLRQGDRIPEDLHSSLADAGVLIVDTARQPNASDSAVRLSSGLAEFLSERRREASGP
ncbi:hypothetical protein [Streptomyces sp. C10-9-1]|uniref:hypothetical protein n=1 Tax=Streptomyces sp. C10-9-1 TaxID=1859285 RepID=UPI003F49D7DC